MARDGFYALGRAAGVRLRRARWFWESVAGSEADAIEAEFLAGRDMAAAVLRETPRDPDVAVCEWLDQIAAELAQVVRNRLFRFQVSAILTGRPEAFALPGGFVFVGRPLVQACGGDRHEIAFVIGHEMSHVIRRHAIDRLLQEKALSAASLLTPARGALAAWIRTMGVQGLTRAHSREQEFEADELGVRLMQAAGFQPGGAIRMLERLGRLEDTADASALTPYLSTHPPTGARAERLRRLKLV